MFTGQEPIFVSNERMWFSEWLNVNVNGPLHNFDFLIYICNYAGICIDLLNDCISSIYYRLEHLQ